MTADALDRALPLLRCPHCGAALERAGEAVQCPSRHSYDVARQGYLSLLAGARSANTGDTAEMVAARERFLEAGHLDRLAEAVAEAVACAAPGDGCVVDLGAGTGWYLARLLDALPEAVGLALDLSKPALRRAARAHPRLAAVACDVWRPLPLPDGVAAAVLNVFAPRNAPEIARVLRLGGVAIFVTPQPDHLEELVRPLGLLGVDERKPERLAGQLASALRITGRRELRWRLRLDRAAARDAAVMGPSAFHISPAELDERIATLPQRVDVTVSVTLATAAGPRARPPAPATAASAAARRRTPPATRPPRSPGGTG
jgi:23S rRNA (guanine745-N1)-methyltransferase